MTTKTQQATDEFLYRLELCIAWNKNVHGSPGSAGFREAAAKAKVDLDKAFTDRIHAQAEADKAAAEEQRIGDYFFLNEVDEQARERLAKGAAE